MKPPGGCVVASAANYHQEARHYLLGQMGAKTLARWRKGHLAATRHLGSSPMGLEGRVLSFNIRFILF